MKSSNSSKNKTDSTDLDLFDSIPKQPEYDPFSGIESLLLKTKKKKKRKKNNHQNSSDVHPTNVRPSSDVHPTNVRPSSDVHPTSDRRTSDVHPTSDLRTSYVHPTSDLRTSDVHPTSDRCTFKICDPDDSIWKLTDRQSIVLGYLIKNYTGHTSRKKINNTTNIPIPTIRDALRVLEREKFITKPHRFKNHGFTYKLHNDLCYRFMKNKWIEIEKIYGENPYILRTSDVHPTSDLRTSDVGHENNKSLLSSSTTTTYWNKKGLTKKQIQQWVNIANCDETTMFRYLDYCRFEMVDLGLEESKPIDNVFNWFYKILEKTGSYPKPKGYKSLEEKRLEEEREVVAEKKRIAEEQKKLYREKIEAIQKTEFFKILNNPDSEMYKKCFKSLNDFTKKRVGKKSFEMAMRAEFDKLFEE